MNLRAGYKKIATTAALVLALPLSAREAGAQASLAQSSAAIQSAGTSATGNPNLIARAQRVLSSERFDVTTCGNGRVGGATSGDAELNYFKQSMRTNKSFQPVGFKEFADKTQDIPYQQNLDVEITDDSSLMEVNYFSVWDNAHFNSNPFNTVYSIVALIDFETDDGDDGRAQFADTGDDKLRGCWVVAAPPTEQTRQELAALNIQPRNAHEVTAGVGGSYKQPEPYIPGQQGDVNGVLAGNGVTSLGQMLAAPVQGAIESAITPGGYGPSSAGEATQTIGNAAFNDGKVPEEQSLTGLGAMRHQTNGFVTDGAGTVTGWVDTFIGWMGLGKSRNKGSLNR